MGTAMDQRALAQSELAPAKRIVFFWSSTPSSLKCRTDCDRIRTMLQAKQVIVEEVDLAENPSRRSEMDAGSAGNRVIPQLHVDGKVVAPNFDELQEMEDAGNLDAILGT